MHKTTCVTTGKSIRGTNTAMKTGSLSKTYLAHYSTMYHLSSSKRKTYSIYTGCVKCCCATVYKGSCTVLEMRTLYRPISRIAPHVAVISESSNFAPCPRQNPMVPGHSLRLPLRVIPYIRQVHRDFSHTL